MPTFQDALQEFAQLLRDTSKEVIQTNRVLVKDICKQLNESLVAPPPSLVQFFESDKTKEKINKYVKQSVEQAVIRRVELTDLDPRLLDVEWAETHRDDQTRFRKGLGERSLGLQYHEWEMQTFQRSKLDDLRKGSKDYNTGEGNIAKFIKAHGFPKKSYVEKAIRTGTRLLLLDHYVGIESASAVVSFAPTRFRDVNFPDLEDLAASLQGNAWIASLMQTIAQWVLDCRAIYNGLIRPRKRNRSVCYGDGRTGHEKRGRQERNAIVQINSRDREVVSTSQSQRTPGVSSRQANDASTHARNTIAYTREETGLNQSQNVGCTAPGNSMPPPASLSVPDSTESSAAERTEDFEAERLCRDEATGLQALVVAADRIESYTPAHASIAAQRRPTRDAQVQQQTRARDEGLIAGQVPGLPPTQAGAVPPVTFGQQAPWQMHTNGRSPATSGAPAGAHRPFEAAGQMQAHDSGSTSGNSQHGLAIGTQAQAQSHPGTWNEGMVAGQPLQPAPYHGPRSLNGTSSNVPSQAGVSSFTLGTTATAAASPWRSDQQLAQPSLPPLNSYTGLGLIGARNGDFPNADVFTQTVHENAFTPVQIRQQIAHGHDTHIQWPSYNEQTLHPEPDHADANTATQSVPSQCRPTNDYCQLQQNGVHDDPTTTDPGATHLRDGEDHLSDDWEEMINVLYSDLGYSTV